MTLTANVIRPITCDAAFAKLQIFYICGIVPYKDVSIDGLISKTFLDLKAVQVKGKRFLMS